MFTSYSHHVHIARDRVALMQHGLLEHKPMYTRCIPSQAPVASHWSLVTGYRLSIVATVIKQNRLVA
jgi:hypothetical protein